MAHGVTLIFKIRSLGDIYIVTDRLTEILSTDDSAENARLVPDMEKGTIYLEIRKIDPNSEFVKSIVEDFKSLDVGEVHIKNYVMPEWAANLPSEKASTIMLETISKVPSDQVEKQLEEKSDPKFWLPEQFVELRFTMEDLVSKFTNLKSDLDVLKTEMTRIKTREELTEKAQKRFYERSNFWFGLISVTVAIVALFVSLISLGIFSPP